MPNSYRFHLLRTTWFVALLLVACSVHGQSTAEPLSDAESDSSNVDSLAELESLVRQSFETDMVVQQARIAKAEAELERIKAKYQERLANAEQIIARRVELLAQKGGNPTSDSIATGASAAALSAEGWQAWMKQDWKTALAKFQASLAIEPTHANTINGLGWTYLHLGKHELAIDKFEESLRHDPNHGGALNGIGQSLKAMGKFDEAITKLEVATQATIDQHGEEVTVENGMTASWFGLVDALITKKEYEKAATWAKRYLKHQPDDKPMNAMLERAIRNEDAGK